MIHGIIDFFCRLRVPSGTQLFGLFYRSRSVTNALTPFTSIVSELQGVAAHHRNHAIEKTILAHELTIQAAAHDSEADGAKMLASKLQGLLI